MGRPQRGVSGRDTSGKSVPGRSRKDAAEGTWRDRHKATHARFALLSASPRRTVAMARTAPRPPEKSSKASPAWTPKPLFIRCRIISTGQPGHTTHRSPRIASLGAKAGCSRPHRTTAGRRGVLMTRHGKPQKEGSWEHEYT